MSDTDADEEPETKGLPVYLIRKMYDLKEKGLCCYCEDPLEHNRAWCCVPCNKERSELAAERVKRRNDRGICRRCPQKIDLSISTTYCPVCSEDNKMRSREIRARRRAEKRCTACGRDVENAHLAKCNSCRKRNKLLEAQRPARPYKPRPKKQQKPLT